MNEKITLYYFPLNGRAALIRALLTFVKANWEDKRVTFEEWPSLKASGIFEFHQVPALEVNGKYYCQSLAIEHYLASKFGLIGNSSEEEYEILSLLCSKEDLYQSLRKVFFPYYDEEKKNHDENKANFLSVILPSFIKIYEKRVSKKTSKYIVGSKLSLADLFLTIYVNIIFKKSRKAEYSKILSENGPNLEKYVEDIEKSDLKEFFEKFFISDSLF